LERELSLGNCRDEFRYRIGTEIEIRDSLLCFPEMGVANTFLAAFQGRTVVTRVGMLESVNDVRRPVLRRNVARSNVEEKEKKLDCRSHQICLPKRGTAMLRNILNRKLKVKLFAKILLTVEAIEFGIILNHGVAILLSRSDM
jgi:hypothetical protein